MIKQRNISIELLRIVSCLLVIGIHVLPPYEIYITQNITDSEKIISLLFQCLVRVGLPVFFVISGIFLLNCKVENIFVFYKKRLLSLLIPFFVFSILHFAIVKLPVGNISLLNLVIEYFKGLLSSTGISFHFWFVYSMLGIYLVTPLVSLLLSSVSSRNALFVLLFLIVIKAYNLYCKGLIAGFSIPDINIWLVYFIIGGLIPRLPKAPMKVYFLVFCSAYVSTCVVTYAQAVFHPSTYLAPFDAGLNMIVMSVSLCMIFYSYNWNASGLIGGVVSKVAGNTYGVYLIHLVVLSTVTTMYDFSWYVGESLQYGLLMIAIVFTASLIIAFVINALVVNPLLKLLIGQRDDKSSKDSLEKDAK